MKVLAFFRWFFLVVIAFGLLFYPRLAFTDDSIFVDEFVSSPVGSLYWQTHPNLPGAIDIVNNNEVRLSSTPGRKFPYMSLNNVEIPENHFSIKTRFKFSGQRQFLYMLSPLWVWLMRLSTR